MSTNVSVIIPVLNAAETLGEQLQSLRGQVGASAREVIVADNGSTDATWDVVEHHRSLGLPVRIIDASQRSGSSHARNIGAAEATGDVFAFCDGDDVADPNWLRELVAALDDFDIVGGRLDGERLNSKTVAGWRPPRVATELSTPEGFLPFAPSGNLGVHAEVWAAVGGMDVDYPRSHDVEFSWRAQLAGHTVGFAADAIMHYRYRATATDTYRQGVKSGRAMAQLFSDFGDDGLRGRPLSATVRDWAWLVVRLPMVVDDEQRGIWARRAGQVIGRAQGSARHRVRYL